MRSLHERVAEVEVLKRMGTHSLGLLEEEGKDLLERFVVTLFGANSHSHKTSLGTVMVVVRVRGLKELCLQTRLAIIEQAKKFVVVRLLFSGVVGDVEGCGLHGVDDEVEQLGVCSVTTCDRPAQQTLHVVVAFPGGEQQMAKVV